MADDLWIVVPNWDRFQHYRDRRPVWIKLYTELNSRDDWLDLTLQQRGLLVTIWLEYARSDGRLMVPQILRQMRSQKGLRYTFSSALHSLETKGWVEVSASKPLAIHARARREEKEKEPLTPRSGGWNPRALGTNPRALAKRDAPRRKAEAWIRNGLAAQVPSDRLPDVIADEFHITDPAIVRDLVALATNERGSDD